MWQINDNFSRRYIFLKCRLAIGIVISNEAPAKEKSRKKQNAKSRCTNKHFPERGITFHIVKARQVKETNHKSIS